MYSMDKLVTPGRPKALMLNKKCIGKPEAILEPENFLAEYFHYNCEKSDVNIAVITIDPSKWIDLSNQI